MGRVIGGARTGCVGVVGRPVDSGVVAMENRHQHWACRAGRPGVHLSGSDGGVSDGFFELINTFTIVLVQNCWQCRWLWWLVCQSMQL